VADVLSRGLVAEPSAEEAADAEADEPAIGKPVQLPTPAAALPSTGTASACGITLQELLATAEEPEVV